MIALIGATGRVGRHVAEQLAAAEVEVRALVRRPAEAGLPVASVAADLTDPPTVRAALAGAVRLLLVTPGGPAQEQLEATAIDAATAAGVRHIVKISGGAPTLGPNGVTPTSVGHWRSERRIERTGLGFTFLRPSFFMQNLLETVAPLASRGGIVVDPFGGAPIAMVDVRDIAACAAAALLNPAPSDQTWQLTGPRPVTLTRLAALLGSRHRSIPPRLVGRALARRDADPHAVDHAVRMAAYFAAGSDGHPTDHVRRLTGAAPRSIEAFLDEHRDQFAPATPLARALAHHAPKETR
ncbi:NAD(P)H-binding protein [Conexibacter stalactiti]|uniref:NAD(P)H-binding protein n=1 Tax=Conexibacter stalactiti TaxID=1940611 RepID=A0ABU4HIF0_9ACTN|nr:NAD(P)H-binding protein [Conexibacter stalactiti]MDW5593087.1 NAD(P)H-binding protein [Conexibacter stalactiti]MEC5033728.1 NAD(P)H-binding protein [Conexibacter stalactiti]